MRNARTRVRADNDDGVIVRNIQEIREERRRQREAEARDTEANRRAIAARDAFMARIEANARAYELSLAVREKPDIPKLSTIGTNSDRIIDRIAKALKVSRRELEADRRQKDIVFARQAVCYWLCRRTNLSLPQIGRKLGGRDHTTVLHGKHRYIKKRKAMGRYLPPVR